MLTNLMPTNASLFPEVRPSQPHCGRVDGRFPTLPLSLLRHTDEGLGVRQEWLFQLLVDEEESLNRLYNIVSQVGLQVLFFDDKERFVGRYGEEETRNDRAAYADLTFTRDSNEKEKSGLAAAIFDAGGELLCFLDVLPTNGNLTGQASTLARTVLRTTARAIEERFFRKQFRRDWIMALASPDGGGLGLLLAINGRQRIVGADRHARAMMGARGVKIESGPTLWTVFEKEPALLGNRNVGDIHAALVMVGDAQIWAAIVTPPQSGALHQHSAEYTTLHTRPRLDSIGRFSRPAPPSSSVGGLTPRALQRIREYIEAHLTDNIKLETLAVMARLSKWHFARAFKQSMGSPPHFYLIQRRLQRAQELLTESDLSLAQISLRSGFSDQSHFSRRFRMFFGVTPRSFRWSKR
jgi:AraC-like DNA-binding protein